MNWNSVLENCNDPKNTVYCLEYCFDQKNIADRIRESFNRIEKKTENFFIKYIIKLVWEPACYYYFFTNYSFVLIDMIFKNVYNFSDILITVGYIVNLIYKNYWTNDVLCLLPLIMYFGL